MTHMYDLTVAGNISNIGGCGYGYHLFIHPSNTCVCGETTKDWDWGGDWLIEPNTLPEPNTVLVPSIFPPSDRQLLEEILEKLERIEQLLDK